MKRSGTLARRTPLQGGEPLRRTSPLPSRSTSATRPRTAPGPDYTDARAKCDAEGACRVCGERPVQAAHILGRRYDRPKPGGRSSRKWVNPLHVVPLCDEHHRAYDAHALDLRPDLTGPEWAAVVELAGEGPALRRVMGAAWRESSAEPAARLADAARAARGGDAPVALRGFA